MPGRTLKSEKFALGAPPGEFVDNFELRRSRAISCQEYFNTISCQEYFQVLKRQQKRTLQSAPRGRGVVDPAFGYMGAAEDLKS